MATIKQSFSCNYAKVIIDKNGDVTVEVKSRLTDKDGNYMLFLIKDNKMTRITQTKKG